MVAPNELESMAFDDTKKAILVRIRPRKKLIVAERTRFVSLKQDAGESVTANAQRLRDAAKYRELNTLNAATATQSAEDELIRMRLNDGLLSTDYKVKVLGAIANVQTQCPLWKVA